MPTYLRWIAAITSGITVFFLYSMLTLGIIRASGDNPLGLTEGGLLSFGAGIMMLLGALAVNDWLIKRYPPPDLARRIETERHERPAEAERYERPAEAGQRDENVPS